MSGKGSKWRKGVNYKKYSENFNEINLKSIEQKAKKVEPLKHGKVRYHYS